MKELVKKAGGAKVCLSLLALAVILSCMAMTLVNSLVNSLLPDETLTVTVNATKNPGNEVWIFDDTGENTLFQSCVNGARFGTWEYRDALEWGYAGNMLCSYGENLGSSVTIQAPMRPESYLTFWKTTTGGGVTVSVRGRETQVDLYSDVSGGEMLKVYPFFDSVLGTVYRVAAYALLSLLFFVVLLSLSLLLERRKTAGGSSFWCKEIKWWYLFPIFLALYLFAIVQYKNGCITNFLEFGDQRYYWLTPLWGETGWQPAEAAVQLVSFRGYMCNLLPTLAQTVARLLGVDPVHLYFLFPSAAIAWLSVYVLPGFYTLLSGKKASHFQVLLFLMVYLFFWNGTLTTILVDLFGTVCFLSGVLFALRFWRYGALPSAALAGVFWSAACSFRTAYQYGIYLILMAGLAVWTYQLVKKRRRAAGTSAVSGAWKKTVIGVAIGVCAFFVVSIPQLQINLTNGHVGMLPYDYVGAWVPEGTPFDTSLLEISANQTFVFGYTGYPYAVSDDQLLTMKPQLYDSGETLHIPQLLSIYARSPLEALLCIAKKMFCAFDVKTSVSYPKDICWRESSGLVFSFLNYFVLGSALYMLFFSKYVTKKERLLTVALFTGLVLPQMFVHVEWRYFLTSYIFLYYLFSYHFTGVLLSTPENIAELKKSNYLPYIAMLIFLSFTISLTLYA